MSAMSRRLTWNAPEQANWWHNASEFRQGADANTREENGRMPLHVAVEYNGRMNAFDGCFAALQITGNLSRP